MAFVLLIEDFMWSIINHHLESIIAFSLKKIGRNLKDIKINVLNITAIGFSINSTMYWGIRYFTLIID